MIRTQPRLHILSDAHLEFGPYRIPDDLAYDILVVPGDLSPKLTDLSWLFALNKPVVYVAGNHEFYGTPDFIVRQQELAEACRDTNVHFLHRSHVDLLGVRFLGCTLWSSFGNGDPSLLRAAWYRMNDYNQIGAPSWYADPDNQAFFQNEIARIDNRMAATEMFNPIVAWSEHCKDVAWLESALESAPDMPVVVVTHMAPSYRSLVQSGLDPAMLDRLRWENSRDDSLYRVAAYASDLHDILRQYRIRIALWCHGHIHHAVDYVESGVRVCSNPRGYIYRRPAPDAPISDYRGNGTDFNAHSLRIPDYNPSDLLAHLVKKRIPELRVRWHDLKELTQVFFTSNTKTRKYLLELFEIRGEQLRVEMQRLYQEILEILGVSDRPRYSGGLREWPAVLPALWGGWVAGATGREQYVEMRGHLSEWIRGLRTMSGAHRLVGQSVAYRAQVAKDLADFVALAPHRALVSGPTAYARYVEFPEWIVQTDAPEPVRDAWSAELDKRFNPILPRRVSFWIRSIEGSPE